MRKSVVKEKVGVFDKVFAQELTVAELDQLLYPVKTLTPMLDRILARHGISAAALSKSTGVELRDDMDCTPSDLAALVDVFKEVNPDFFLMMENEQKQVDLIARIDAGSGRK